MSDQSIAQSIHERLLMALESLLAESTRVDSGASPYQVVVQKCPACKEKTVGRSAAV